MTLLDAQNDHAIYPLPDAPGMSPQALRAALVAAPLGALLWYGLWRLGCWLLDAAERVVYAVAGAAFVVCIGASFGALAFAGMDLFTR